MDDLRPRLEKALADNYVFERELGGGGMSRTYLAREKALDRRVVVKVLAPELLAGISVERFRREVLLAAKLQHPHVVPVLTAGDIDGLPWFTMPYVDGDSLRHRLTQGPVGIGEAVSILRDVARALAYAHGQNIVHRDIKPDNVLLSTGSATVTDFGIAKAISAARTTGSGGGHASTMLTVAGTSIGTPMYMAPEQAAGDPSTDHRADIYAFGAMAYELLAGHPPFHSLTPARLLAAHMGEKPKDIRTLRADCPEALAEVVMRCLEKEPTARPQHATDLVRVLDSITSSGAANAAPTILGGGRIRLGKALAIWAAATAGTSLTAWAATSVIGLPDWVFPGILGVMIAGLPAILGTWYVQRAVHRAYVQTPTLTPGGSTTGHGTMATLAIRASPHVSWRRTWLGGGIAVGGFAVLVIAFMVMRAMGVGPFGSLRGKGTFGAKETIVVADFTSPQGDSTLGSTIAEALRTDLAQSSSLKVLTRASIRDILRLMQRPPESAVPFDLAREIATREGAKAVLDGGVERLGKGYVVSARLVNALDGTELVTFRETAASDDQLIEALGKLGRSVRERAGEPLRSIQQSSELERVTTPSLDALRKYVEGARVADELGDSDRGLALLQEAVTIDSGFAMAWRKIAVLLNNDQREPARAMAATETAYRHRDRLTEEERDLTEGYYYTLGPKRDRDKAIAAYDAALILDSTSTSALNNLAVELGEKRDYVRAEAIYKRVTALPHSYGGAFTNLMQEQIRLGHVSGLDSTKAAFHARFPTSAQLPAGDWYDAWGKGDLAAADSIGLASYNTAKTVAQAVNGAGSLSSGAELRGRPQEALKWAVASDAASYKAHKSKGVELTIDLDTVYYYAAMLERPAEARAVWTRTMARVPMSQVTPAERQWTLIARIAARMHDPAMARMALDGFEHDLASQAPDADGRRAFFAGHVALAEGKWDEAIRQLEEADKRVSIFDKYAYAALAQAHDFAGHSDSAIVYFEKFVKYKDPNMNEDAQFLAGSYKRLGELYEAKGSRDSAIANYEKFVDLWKDAEPEMQPKVAEVRERLSRLRGKKG
ncbi:MAG TPA: protein kinase [Gemmatimonadaceae bacterium]|nr:protein kinase [Gemmatimonadaceae bacterium]